MDWAPIVGALLGSVSPTTSIIGLLNQVMTLVNHITKDDPVAQLKARRDYLAMLNQYTKGVANAKTGEDVSKIVLDWTALLNSK